MNELQGRRVAFMTANEGVEQVELTEPWEAILRAGGDPDLISPRVGQVQAFNHLDRGEVFHATVATADANVDDYDALVLPGGVANPDQLRTDEPAVRLVRSFFETGRPVAVICHGPWTIVEADCVRDRMVTSWPSLQTDIRNAGGTWVDEVVVVCSNGPNVLVSSRKPDDLPSFDEKLVRVFSQAGQPARTGRR
jgi:protease I